jgi:glycosyltransferase involved in cell wall biosynthesis
MMHVLMTADAVGGVWTYALELARALAPSGVRVTVATMGPRPSAAQLRDGRDIPGLDVEMSDFALEWRLDTGAPPWDDLYAAGTWLLALERRIAPGIVHLNGYAHGALPFNAPTIVVGHSCVSSWCEATRTEMPPLALASYRRIVRAGLRRADCVVAPTRAMLAALERHYGPLERSAVIPNGRDARRFPVTEKQPLVVGGGRVWDPAKNLALLRDNAAALSWPVVIAGPDSLDTPPVAERDMLALLARASIFVLPAKYEPFGLLPLEAALCGCALVLGDIPSLREVWGGAASYVDSSDGAALCRQIEALIENPPLLRAQADAARARARRYTAGDMARQYADLYEQLQRSRVCA